MKKITCLILLLIITLTMFFPGIQSASNVITIDIFHTNNTNGYAESSTNSIGFAKFKTLFDNSTANGKIALDAGNIFSGNPFATKSRGESIAKLISAVPYTAITVGNNDFSYNQVRISDLKSDYKLNVLSVNVKAGNNLIYNPYHMETINGVKIGILGITTPKIKTTVNELFINDLKFGNKESIISDAKKSVTELKNKGANIIIAITHLGSNEEDELTAEDIAKNVKGINLIVDGHGNDAIKDGAMVNSVIITRCKKNFESLGISRISYDKTNKKITSIATKTHTANDLKTTPESSEIKKLISNINEESETVDKTVLAKTSLEFSILKAKESSKIGNLIALCMQNEFESDGAIISSGDIKDTILPGNITRRTIENILPKGNTIVLAKVNGKWLNNYFNKVINSDNDAFPQISGIKLYLNGKSKVSKITVAGKAVKPSDSFMIATTDVILEKYQSYNSYVQSDSVHEVCIRQIEMNQDVLKQANEQVNIIKSGQNFIWYTLLFIVIIALIVLAVFIWIYIKRREKSPQ